MNKIIENIAKLINVKSIVTVVLLFVFSFLSIKGVVNSDQFLSIFTVVIAFYFGTQFEKKATQKDDEAKDK